MAVLLAVAGNVFDGCPVSPEISWMTSGTELNQFRKTFFTLKRNLKLVKW